MLFRVLPGPRLATHENPAKPPPCEISQLDGAAKSAAQMSGIAGILNLDGTAVDEHALHRMAKCMAFRGPDGLDIWTNGPVGFAYALLRTFTQAERERQPHTVDGSVWILADARIDSRQDLSERLESHQPRDLDATTDAELILRAYHVWGESCPEKLRGDFAFAIWDARQRRLFCARDPLGVKPFYHACVGEHLIFSNTLQSVRAYPGVSDELNQAAIADFLLFGWNQELDTTCFSDIQRLPPAHKLVCSGPTVCTRKYWTLPIEEPIRYKRPLDYVEHFAELLRAAVDDRLGGNRVGILMSGGLDSTSVAATAKRVLSSGGTPFAIRAFTVDYRPLFADEESDYARLAAEGIGIPIQVLAASKCTPYERWDEPGVRKPEPTEDPFAALSSDHLRQMAAHGRVALSGDGGDVLLHGESWPYLVRLFRRAELARLVSELGSYVLSRGQIPPLLGGFRARWRRFTGTSEPTAEYPVWLNSALEQRLSLRARWEHFHRKPAAPHPIHPTAYDVLTGPYWPSTFETLDAGFTGVPVEVRSPFFDLRLVRYCLRLPPIPWCARKELLRQAMQGPLPETVRCRAKTPLAADPLAEMLKQKLWRADRRLLTSPELADFVDLEHLPPVTGMESSETIRLNLRPFSLHFWLRYGRDSSAAEATNEGVPENLEEAVSSSQIHRLREYR